MRVGIFVKNLLRWIEGSSNVEGTFREKFLCKRKTENYKKKSANSWKFNLKTRQRKKIMNNFEKIEENFWKLWKTCEIWYLKKIAQDIEGFIGKAFIEKCFNIEMIFSRYFLYVSQIFFNKY